MVEKRRDWKKRTIVISTIVGVIIVFLILIWVLIKVKEISTRKKAKGATELVIPTIPKIVPQKEDSLKVQNEILWKWYTRKSKEVDSLMIANYALQSVIDSIQDKDSVANQLTTKRRTKPQAVTSQRSSCPPPPPQVDPYTGYAKGQEQAQEGW